MELNLPNLILKNGGQLSFLALDERQAVFKTHSAFLQVS